MLTYLTTNPCVPKEWLPKLPKLYYRPCLCLLFLRIVRTSSFKNQQLHICMHRYIYYVLRHLVVPFKVHLQWLHRLLSTATYC